MNIGIVGTGSLGAGIAQVAAQAGHEVFLYDAQPQVGQQALARIDQSLQKEVEKGRSKAGAVMATLQRIAWVDQLEKFRPCDWVINTYPCELATRRLRSAGEKHQTPLRYVSPDAAASTSASDHQTAYP